MHRLRKVAAVLKNALSKINSIDTAQDKDEALLLVKLRQYLMFLYLF